MVLVLAASLAAYGPGSGVGRGAVGAGAAGGGAAWLTAPLPPISFSETSSYIRLGLTHLAVEFYKGSAGYNKIYDGSGAVAVYDDRIVLEYWAGSKWSQRGVSTGISWVKVSDTHYEVTRSYTDYLGTTYDVGYTVKSGEAIKITITLRSGKADTIRVAWRPSGIVYAGLVEGVNGYRFEDAAGWIGFDWGDVYRGFGDITQASVEVVANGKKANIYFSVGAVGAGQVVVVDPTIEFSTALVESVHVCPLDADTFVVAYSDDTNNDISFQVWDMDGTLVLAETDADTDIGYTSCTSVGVSALDATHFVIGWYDGTDTDATFAVYDTAGLLHTGPTDADTDVGGGSSVSVSALNATQFVIGWYDGPDYDATFAVYDTSSNLITGPTDADTDVGASYSISVQVSALSSTSFAISWHDAVDFDLTFATYYSNGTAIAAPTDVESWPTAVNNPFWYQSPSSQECATGIGLADDRFVVAYANTTTQAIWKTYNADGTAWEPLSASPVNGATTITDLDDADNLYAQLDDYTISCAVSDVNGYADIHTVDISIMQGATTRETFQYHEDDNTFSVTTANAKFGLGTGSSASHFGNVITITLKLRALWAADEEADVDLKVVTTDAGALSDTDTIQTDYADVVKTLTVSGFASSPVTYVNPSTSTTFSGTVYYVNNPASSTATTFYPPDAEFTSVAVHNAAHSVKETDATIVNGAFSLAFNSDAAVGADTYHPFIAMADADYTDADAPGITDAVTVEQVKVISYTVADARVNVNDNVNVDFSIQYASDSANVVDGAVTLNTGAAAYQSGSTWRRTATSAAASGATYDAVAATGNARGITSVDQNAQSTLVIWDRFDFISVAVDDARINVGGTFELRYVLQYDYDNVVFDDTKGSITGFAYDGVNLWWDKAVAGSASVTSTNYDETYIAVTDTTYGITAKEDDAGTSVVTDRIRLLTLAASKPALLAGETVIVLATAELEYDAHPLGAGDNLTISTYPFAWSAVEGKFRWEHAEASAAAIALGVFTAGYEAGDLITVGDMNGLSATMTWASPGGGAVTPAATTTPLPDYTDLQRMGAIFIVAIILFAVVGGEVGEKSTTNRDKFRKKKAPAAKKWKRGARYE